MKKAIKILLAIIASLAIILAIPLHQQSTRGFWTQIVNPLNGSNKKIMMWVTKPLVYVMTAGPLPANGQ